MSDTFSKEFLERLMPDWTSDAKCLGQWSDFDYDLESIMGLDDVPYGMSVELYAGVVERETRAQRAINICWTECPVRRECLAHALDNGLIESVRGGYTPPELAIIFNKYQQGQSDQF